MKLSKHREETNSQCIQWISWRDLQKQVLDNTVSTNSLRNTFQQLFCHLISDIQINQISNFELIKQLLDFSILKFWFYISVMMMKSKFLKKLN